MLWGIKSIYDIKESSNSKYVGYIFALLSAVLYATVNIMAKFLLGSSEAESVIDPFVLMTCVAFTNFVFFSTIVRSKIKTRLIDRKLLSTVALMAAIIVASAVFFYFGLRESTAVNATIIISAEVALTVGIAAIIYKERILPREIVPFLMIIVGTIVLPIGNDFYSHGLEINQIVYGDVLLFIASIFFALDTTISKYLSERLDAIKIMQLGSGFISSMGVLLVLAQGIPFNVGIQNIPYIVFIGVFGIGISGVLFMTALRLIGAIRSILIYSTNVIFGVIFASVFLGEAVILLNGISIIFALIGVYMLRERLAS